MANPPLSAQVLGLGGGGAMFAPQISPINPLILFVACDGTGLYRSDNGGRTWRLVDGAQAQGYGVYQGVGYGTLGFSVAFDKAGNALAFRTWIGLVYSAGAGPLFQPYALGTNPPSTFTDGGQCTAAAYDGNNRLAVAIADSDANGAFSQLAVFDPATNKWTIDAKRYTVLVTNLVATFDNTGQPYFAAAIQTATGRDDVLTYSGASWSSIASGGAFPTVTPLSVLHLAGAGTSSNAMLSALQLFCTVDTNPGTTDSCSVLAWTGSAWSSITGNLPLSTATARHYYDLIGVNNVGTPTLYLAGHNLDMNGNFVQPSVWTQALPLSGTWQPSYDVSQNVTLGWLESPSAMGIGGWGLGGPPISLAVDPANAGHAVVAGKGELSITSNGNAPVATAKWQQHYSLQVPPNNAWTSIGLEVTTTWDYFISGATHYILYTDIGLATSIDGGFTWNSAAGTWGNWYQIIDTGAGTLAAAVSQLHDLPTKEQWTQAKNGAVLTNTNGAGWVAPANAGLPTSLPVSSVQFGRVKNLVDSMNNPINTPVLLAAVWDQKQGGQGGVYYSQNLGGQWFGPLPGMNAIPGRCYRLVFDGNGDLYCVVAFPPSGNIYKWDSPNRTFTAIVLSSFITAQFGGAAFFWPIDLTTRVSPSSGKVELYCGTFGVQNGQPAKVIKFDGTTWGVLNVPVNTSYNAYPNFFGAYFYDPFVYVTSDENGTWFATIDEIDGTGNFTASWAELDLPFKRTQRIFEGPDKTLFISTFGYGMLRVAFELVSWYFAIFRRLQVLQYPQAGMTVGNEPTTAAQGGVNWIGSTTADSPLYMGVRNAAGGTFTNFPYGGQSWPTPANSAAWQDLGGAGLTNAIAAWLPEWVANAKNLAIPQLPNMPTGQVPTFDTVGKPVLFVCSDPADDGQRPGIIKSDFWDYSVIGLCSPQTGQVPMTMATLHASDEWWVAAAMGNRGNGPGSDGGRYVAGTAGGGPLVQTRAWATAFGTGGFAPGVALPSLENLEPDSAGGLFEVYSIPQRQYELVGFRLNVRNVYDGLVEALQRSDSPINLGGLTPEQWLHSGGAHLCLRVAVNDGGWPAFDASPLSDRRIAQKNLVPFDVDLTNPSPIPNIIWNNLLIAPMSNILRPFRDDPQIGQHTLHVHTNLAEDIGRVVLAVPKSTHDRFVRHDDEDDRDHDSREHGRWRPPFAERHVTVPVSPRRATRLPLRHLGENLLGMSLGLALDRHKLRPGMSAQISVVQHATVPSFERGSRTYRVRDQIVGGCTIVFRVLGSR